MGKSRKPRHVEVGFGDVEIRLCFFSFQAFPTYSDGKMCVKFTSLEKDGKVHMFTRELIDGEMVHVSTLFDSTIPYALVVLIGY